MRQDWIEFEVDHGKLFVKYYDVESFRHVFNGFAGSCTSISLSNGTNHLILEPYEQVKQKIMDAEKIDLSDVVEHFTREEYRMLLYCLEMSLAKDRLVQPLMDKLNEILKEDK